MAAPTLKIDLSALAANWRDLAARMQGETGAVVKANAYGLGVDRVAPALAAEGVRRFFVAHAREGVLLRRVLGSGPEIFVFNGHMAGDATQIRAADLVPLLNSVDQMLLHVEALPDHAFGIQLDTGMNRLGMEPSEWAALRDIALAQRPRLVMSHLACADEPDHAMNARQLRVFREMTDGINVPRSFSATGGILLGPDYQFDLARPGIGLYGGAPFSEARPVAHLEVPVIQIRDVAPGETVGYGNTWTAARYSRIATIAAGYADGLHRIMGPRAGVHADGVFCPVVGRISMDLIGVDVTDLKHPPERVEMLGRHQTVDTLAEWAGSIGYEILTSLGARYTRQYVTA